MNKINSSHFLCALMGLTLTFGASVASASEDERIRRIVSEMLQEKDRKIEQLEARIRQLEQKQNGENAYVKGESGVTTAPITAIATAPIPTEPPKTAENKQEATVASQLQALDKKIDELKTASLEKGLDISGFFDINAKTSNSTDQTFSVGLLELDIAYNYDEHLAASTALVLCGNSSGADYATAPAHITCGNSSLIGNGSGSAAIAVGLIDYHWFDSSIPPRGRIFDNQGFHIQAGRFDLPFSTDYQNFANKDRITITSPITTVRMQKGGFNGDGIRSYGRWGMFNYSLFWTNGVYQNEGTSVGGRVGILFGNNPYRIQTRAGEGIELGLSHLTEFDGDEKVRNTFYGADLSLGHGPIRIQNEFMLLQAHQTTPAQYDNDGHPTFYSKNHQLGYHSTLIADLARWLDRPLLLFVRYGRWQPNQEFAIDSYGSGSAVRVSPISLLSLGLNYKFNEHLRIKLEYTDSLGTETTEHFFDRQVGMSQMIVSF